MINRKDFEKIFFPKHIPEFTPAFAESLRESALIVLSSKLKGSRDVLRPNQRLATYGQGVAQVLGYDTRTLPHLTILKTALNNSLEPALHEPKWLGGYALRPFPHPSTFPHHEHITVAGIRDLGDVREVYYGSHPDSADINVNSGVISPSEHYNRMSMGVLSSPLDPARHSKLRFWFSPYEISGAEWRERLVEDVRLNKHLSFEGTFHYDGFTRHGFAVDRQGLAKDVDPGEEQAIVNTAAPYFGITELCQAQVGKQNWHVYASGAVRATAHVGVEVHRPRPVLEASVAQPVAATRVLR